MLAKIVLNIGTNHRRGHFRLESEARLASVGERVHFFHDNIGQFTDASSEERRLLEYWSPDLFVVERVHHRPNGAFDELPV